MATQSEVLAAAGSDASSSTSYPTSFAAWYSVAVLMVMYIFSFIDRTTISLLVEPMKRDLQISDTQIGLLQGLAFVLLYTFLGLPIARLSDRHSRRGIIAAGVFVWSIMATLCGLARSAIQLFIARIGVGVGEAALSPAAYSIITDSFPRSKLGGAFGVYNIGITIGAGTALLLGGIVVGAVSHAGASYTLPLFGEVRAWQMVFIVTGAPGMLLPLLLLTFREPKRRGLLRNNAPGQTGAPVNPALREVLTYVWLNREFYALHFVAMALLALCGYAVASWLPASLVRAYGVSAGQVGKVMGVSTILMNSSGHAPGRRRLRSPDPSRLEGRAHRGRADLGLRYRLIQLSAAPDAHGAAGMDGDIRCRHHLQRLQRSRTHGRQSGHAESISRPGLGRLLVRGQRHRLRGGTRLVPFVNDHVFHDPVKIRYSLVIVVFCSAVTAIILLWKVRPIYRLKLAEAARGNSIVALY